MSRLSYAKTLDEALRPFGFSRKDNDWIRVRGDMWECVNRQSNWLGGITVNLMMKDLETEKLFIRIFSEDGAVQMPPTSVRIGDLIDGYDRWWRRDQPDGPRQMAEVVVASGLSWFDRARTPEAQAENWFGRKTALTDRGYHGPSLIGLALTLYRMGELEEACEILCKPVPKTAIQASVKRVARLRKWLGCDPAS